uniref:Uncharacterized protein n=1 Tax=Periophthalmus magnuspinnatus TaxID=409849 RepID=A0A3B4B715_9GOBI
MSSKPISVLITGANRGLGLEMVKQMVDTQSPLTPLSVLFACCRDPDGPRAERIHFFVLLLLDTADRSSIRQSAEQVGSLLGEKGLNLVINNAAILINSTLVDSTPEDMAKTFNTNVIGPMSVIQEFLPYLRAAAKNSEVPGMSCRKAAVVNMSSIIGSIENIQAIQKYLTAVPYRISKVNTLLILKEMYYLHTLAYFSGNADHLFVKNVQWECFVHFWTGKMHMLFCKLDFK